ncbi:LEAF RUST 10 DISEASE-RESISTANCE LOCUS RECEPTOR-LIKE PROTEIN KINASE-like 1.4 isoform X2 [Prosopis cineraria]|uniref:LEAF RUST 10 DISEASE-RESISTANCE LOCUS RECEPTOR-LIKE PROTEIN KINASE-like 1.4 isoform X2 n=1 Tax=Prosopis cineraria TaxID=364024 RepID=UPI0024106988|nr:LEAF RUST 10 DISEASE-RESISTANCE LOCUS RECEPTOR-LIKE PROTEIN KINASE-like 1.4 isoform X2 [Prosopis cineraria]
MQLHSSISVSIFIISITLYHIPICFCVYYETNCSSSFACGNLKNLGYPFWGSKRPEYCGHPDFKLDCGGEYAEITIMSESYRVLEVNYSDYSLRVVRTDFSNDACPTYFRNNSINLDFFKYRSDSHDLTLYYGCPSPPSSLSHILSNQFNCTINNTKMVDYFLTEVPEIVPSSEIEVTGTCKSTVIVPILASQVSFLEENPSAENLKAAIHNGFGLVWNADNNLCYGCRKSGGGCGYNTISSEFSCYCRDGPVPSACGSKKKSKSKVTTGIIAAAAAGAFLILLGLCLFFMVRRRKRIAEQSQSKDLFMAPFSRGVATSTTNSSQSVPSYITSKTESMQHSFFYGVKVFSYAELEEATKNFDPSMELGNGGFGTVYYGTLKDGRTVAVKRLYESNLKRVDQFRNEVEILAKLHHKNLVELYGCTSRHSRELLLVYEYIPNGTVSDHLQGNRSKSSLLPWPTRLNIAIETADALAYLHRSDIIHRDVKTNNILLDHKFCVKVADFGLSRLFPNDVTHVSTAPQGTPGYVDPEYYQCYQLTNKSDVYSFGVVLVELISSLEAVDITRHRHDINLANLAINRIQNHQVHELIDPLLGFERDNAIKQMTTAVAELAFRCLQQDGDMRPSMDEVLEVLRGIQKEGYGRQDDAQNHKRVDEIMLLKDAPPPFSPDSVADKWVSSSTASSSL